MRIKLERGNLGSYLLICDNGYTRLIQTDWDYPGTATTFGWQACPCGATDGTIDCAHRTASEMIAEARQFLDEHIGAIAQDPGYFT